MVLRGKEWIDFSHVYTGEYAEVTYHHIDTDIIEAETIYVRPEGDRRRAKPETRSWEHDRSGSLSSQSFAVPGREIQEGQFEIRDIPLGTYNMVIRHPYLGSTKGKDHHESSRRSKRRVT